MTREELEKLQKEMREKAEGKVGVPMAKNNKGLVDFFNQLLGDIGSDELEETVSYTERELAYEEYLMKIDIATQMYLEGVLNSLTINRVMFNKAVAQFKKERDDAIRKSVDSLEKNGNVVQFPTKENSNGK
jgi:hypothetical protein